MKKLFFILIAFFPLWAFAQNGFSFSKKIDSESGDTIFLFNHRIYYLRENLNNFGSINNVDESEIRTFNTLICNYAYWGSKSENELILLLLNTDLGQGQLFLFSDTSVYKINYNTSFYDINKKRNYRLKMILTNDSIYFVIGYRKLWKLAATVIKNKLVLSGYFVKEIYPNWQYLISQEY